MLQRLRRHTTYTPDPRPPDLPTGCATRSAGGASSGGAPDAFQHVAGARLAATFLCLVTAQRHAGSAVQCSAYHWSAQSAQSWKTEIAGSMTTSSGTWSPSGAWCGSRGWRRCWKTWPRPGRWGPYLWNNPLSPDFAYSVLHQQSTHGGAAGRGARGEAFVCFHQPLSESMPNRCRPRKAVHLTSRGQLWQMKLALRPSTSTAEKFSAASIRLFDAHAAPTRDLQM